MVPYLFWLLVVCNLSLLNHVNTNTSIHWSGVIFVFSTSQGRPAPGPASTEHVVYCGCCFLRFVARLQHLWFLYSFCLFPKNHISSTHHTYGTFGTQSPVEKQVSLHFLNFGINLVSKYQLSWHPSSEQKQWKAGLPVTKTLGLWNKINY